MADETQAHDGSDRSQGPARLVAIDALRGLIMVLMALDHANHFVAQKHPPSEIWDGVFPIYYDPLAFLTRLVTHLAAPGFFLLMGVGVALFVQARQKAGWDRQRIVGRLCLRGLLLMFLQLLIVNRAWELSPGGWGVRIYIGVLFALGGAMVLISRLAWLRSGHLFALAALLFLGTELLHPGLGMWSTVSHRPLEVILLYPGGTSALWAYYPLLPWLELAVLGLALGKGLSEQPDRAYVLAWKLGLAFLAGFVVVRALDGFGNIRPRLGDAWIDWLNPVKYPPSMAFTLMTTGTNLLLLWLFSRLRGRVTRALGMLAALGRTPLLFYVLHLFLYALLGRLLTPNGSSIPAMYPVWLLGLLVLYPVCLWYGRWKRDLPAASVGRLL